MLRLSNIKYPVSEQGISIHKLISKTGKLIHANPKDISDITISKQSIDARDKNNVVYILSVDFNIKNEDKYLKSKNISLIKPFDYIIPAKKANKSPVIVGFGPAGMMAGLVLAKAGLNPIILERGKSVEQRKQDVDTFWQRGILNTQSNVQFGEGGAGAFSDGKLNSGIKNPRCRLVLEEFVKAGAPKEILYHAKPHVGTDKLLPMVKNIRKQIISLGGDIRFEHQLVDITSHNGSIKDITVNSPQGKYTLDTDYLILAVGHSARDTFELLMDKNIPMEQKPFAMGVRIEHSQDMINHSQYGDFAKYLPPADYKLVAHLPNGRSAYTFCMCPGGIVVASSSEPETIVTNGMSYYSRDGINANSALLIGIEPKDLPTKDPLAGVAFQRELEHKAYIAGGSDYSAPIQLVGDILIDSPTKSVLDIQPTYKPNTRGSHMKDIFPDFMYDSIKLGIQSMDKQIKGFASPSATITAVESRSSSPVKILRNNTLNSPAIKGLMPCGEGCGYAGGIMSAAVDGIKCAESVIENI